MENNDNNETTPLFNMCVAPNGEYICIDNDGNISISTNKMEATLFVIRDNMLLNYDTNVCIRGGTPAYKFHEINDQKPITFCEMSLPRFPTCHELMYYDGKIDHFLHFHQEQPYHKNTLYANVSLHVLK